jgi:hypothetical protein
MVHGFGGGFTSVAARLGGNDERRRAKSDVERYMAEERRRAWYERARTRQR